MCTTRGIIQKHPFITRFMEAQLCRRIHHVFTCSYLYSIHMQSRLSIQQIHTLPHYPRDGSKRPIHGQTPDHHHGFRPSALRLYSGEGGRYVFGGPQPRSGLQNERTVWAFDKSHLQITQVRFVYRYMTHLRPDRIWTISRFCSEYCKKAIKSGLPLVGCV